MNDIYVYKQTKHKSGSLILDVSTCCLTGRDKILFLQELIPFWTPPVKQNKIVELLVETVMAKEKSYHQAKETMNRN